MPHDNPDPNLDSTENSGPTIVRAATQADAPAIRAIYNHEAENERTTMDVRGRSLAEQETWIADRAGVFAAIVAERDGVVVGFGALSPFKDKPGYATTVENSVHVSREARASGVGRAILAELVRLATEHGFHSIIARIVDGNEASIVLHERLGYAHVGVELEVGRKLGRWCDVVVMQHLATRPTEPR